MTSSFLVLDSVCSSQLSVKFIPKNRTEVSDTIPRGVFRTLDHQNLYSQIMQKPMDDNALEVQKSVGSVTMALPELPDKAAYLRFKRVCSAESTSETEEREVKNKPPTYLMYIITEVYACLKELWNNEKPLHHTHITPMEFQNFVLAASYLNIRKEYAKHFAENMAKYGLLGIHSADIISTAGLSTYDLPYKTFQKLLYAFLRQTDFKYRASYSTTGQTMLRIENTNLWSNQINEEYTGPFQTARMRTVLHSELGPASSQEKERNEAVLAWLLSNMGGSSVDIQYYTTISSDNSTDLSQVIKKFTKENEKGRCVYVEGLTLGIDYRRGSFSLRPALRLVPDLSRLEVWITPEYIPNEELFSFFSSITLCKNLKALRIAGQCIESEIISRLLEGLPSIEQLNLFCNRLDSTAIDSFKKCAHLEKLKIYGTSQPNTTVQVLVKHLPSLKYLRINCDALEPAAAESFHVCKNLESLILLCHLQITSSFLIKLLEILPSLQYLKMSIGTADFALSDALRKCSNLRSLELKVWNYSPGFLAFYLQAPLPNLKFLKFVNLDDDNDYNEEDNNRVKEVTSMVIQPVY
ncbi:hypothetical protein NECID01_0543 [Nematocida sp. AWRm77]|nr:hypothetical protein NECID01_0543 [Nematocida sp. AWRm77]